MTVACEPRREASGDEDLNHYCQKANKYQTPYLEKDVKVKSKTSLNLGAIQDTRCFATLIFSEPRSHIYPSVFSD